MPRKAPVLDFKDEIHTSVDEKTGRKRGFLWDIIYNLGFLEELILEQDLQLINIFFF